MMATTYMRTTKGRMWRSKYKVCGPHCGELSGSEGQFGFVTSSQEGSGSYPTDQENQICFSYNRSRRDKNSLQKKL